MNNLNDIIKGCQKGKSSAQKQLYQTFASKMFAVCLRYCKDKTEAEDCLQEGFIKVFNNIDKFGFKGSFEGWVRRIMVNTVIEVYRKKQPELLVDDFPLLADEDGEESYDVSIHQDELMAMIQGLPPKYKLVFNLYVIEGLSHAEIAKVSGISVGTSKSNLARARQWLKKSIEERMLEKKASCMLEDRKDIDAVFKNGLTQHEVEPDAYVWASIEKSLQKQKHQASALIIWRSVAAACIVVLIGVSVGLLFTVSNPSVNNIVEIKVNDTHEVSVGEQENVTEELEPIQSIVVEEEPVVKDEQVIISPVESTNAYQSYYAYGGETLMDEKYLESISSVDLNVDNRLNTDLHLVEKPVYFPLYNSDEQLSDKKKMSISIGGVVAPSYNSKMSYGGNESVMAASSADVNESGINSLGGGVQLRVNNGSRWSFETGVLYAQVGQEASSNYSRQPYSEAFLNGQNIAGVEVANSMGTIVTTTRVSNDSGLFYGDKSANMVEAVNNPVSSVDAVKQTLDYIEIPMIVRYSLFRNFPYLSVAGGISSNFLVDNTAYAVDGSSEQEIGETSNIKSFVLSSSVGLGIDVPLFKSIHLNVEPRLKYFLNSVSSNADYNFQPYSFGVYGGLTFVIK